MKRYSLFTLFAAALVLSFQNCAGYRSINAGAEEYSSFDCPECQTGLTSIGTIDTNCATNPNFNACIYNKNPVAQTGQTFSSTPLTLLNSAQRYGVNLRGVDSAGLLRNSLVTVLPDESDSGELVRPVNDQWKFTPSDPGKLAQVSAFYWLQYFASMYESNPVIANLYARNHNLFLFAYEPYIDNVLNNNAYFSPPAIRAGPVARLVIGVGANQTPLAYSGEVLIHEFSHANFYYATSGATNDYSTATYANCLEPYKSVVSNSDYQAYAYKCCKSAQGCMRAIDEATADFHAAVTFPAQPVIGEAYANSLQGISACGDSSTVKRNPSANASLTASAAYSACTGSYNGTRITLSGEVYMMSTVYSSVLWEIRKTMQSQVPAFPFGTKQMTGAELFQLIVYEAEPSFVGSETFVSAKAKLKDTANTIRSALSISADLAGIIEAEFNRRGL